MINKRTQQGMAVLSIIILLLAVLGLLALLTSRNVVSEQRFTSNDLRRRQALDAADGGLAFGIATAINDSPSVETDPSVTTINDQLNPTGEPAVGSVVSIKICPPTGGNKYRVIAVGQSDDGKASRTVEQWIAITSADSGASGYVAGSWRDYGVTNSC